MSKLVSIAFRQYTNKGDLVSVIETTIDYPSEVWDFINPYLYEIDDYRRIVTYSLRTGGVLNKDEYLVPFLKTNISIRDPKTGQFLPWPSK